MGRSGIKLLAQQDLEKNVDICLPEHMHGRNVYYKCAPGKRYKTVITIDCPKGGQKLLLQIEVRDSEGDFIKEIKDSQIILKEGEHTYEAEFYVPHLPKMESIYYDDESNNTIQILAKARVSNLNEAVLVKKFSLLHDNKPPKQDIKISFDDEVYSRCDDIKNDSIIRLGKFKSDKDRSVLNCEVGKSGRISVLVRVNDIDWQFRNAAVSDKGQYLEVNSIRSPWTPDKKIIISPITDTTRPFVSNIELIDHCKIYPLNRDNNALKVDVLSFDSGAKIKVVCDHEPKSVTGASKWSYFDGDLEIEVDTAKTIAINWD